VGNERKLASNHRPIAIASSISKCLELFALLRLRPQIEENGWMSLNQIGFRKHHNCADSQYILLELVRHANAPVFGAFIDVSSAFDKVFRSRLWNNIFQIGVKGRLWRFLQAMYKSANICIRRLDDLAEPFSTSSGIRQGSLCSPILYALFIEELIEAVTKLPHGVNYGNLRINILNFADDIFVVADTKEGLQCILDVCSQYAEKMRFKFNVSIKKSEAVIFNKRLFNDDIVPQFMLSGLPLPLSDGYCFLGLFLTPDLIWETHISRRLQKANVAFNSLCSHVFKYLSYEQRIHVYKAVVLPMCLYASPVFWPVCKDNFLASNEFVSMHRLHLKTLLGLRFDPCSYAYVLLETGQRPIMTELDHLAVLHYLRLLSLPVATLAQKVLHEMLRMAAINVYVSPWLKGISEILNSLGVSDISSLLSNKGINKAALQLLIENAAHSFLQMKLSENHDSISMQLYCQIKWLISKYEPHLNMANTKLAKFISRLRCSLHHGAESIRVAPMCRRCSIGHLINFDTVEHLLLYCLAFHNERHILTTRLLETLPDPWYDGLWGQATDIEQLCFMLDRNIEKYPRGIHSAIITSWEYIDQFLSIIEAKLYPL
jgi:hypothetical protein